MRLRLIRIEKWKSAPNASAFACDRGNASACSCRFSKGMTNPLCLIGFAVAVCRPALALWYSRLRRLHLRLGRFALRLPSLMQLVAEVVLRLLKLLYGLAHSTSKFG